VSTERAGLLIYFCAVKSGQTIDDDHRVPTGPIEQDGPTQIKVVITNQCPNCDEVSRAEGSSVFVYADGNIFRSLGISTSIILQAGTIRRSIGNRFLERNVCR